MPTLSTLWIAIIATVVLALMGLGYLLFGWLRKRSGRVLLRGLGVILIPAGLMIMGWMELGVEGVRYLIDWSNANVMTTRIMIGLGLAGLGLVSYLIGTFMAPIVGEEAKKRRAEIVAKRAALNGPPPAKTASGGVPFRATPAPAAAPLPVRPPAGSGAAAAIDPSTDDEIDAILRRHGIQ